MSLVTTSPMQQYSCTQYCHRAAIVLNNTGVTFLERGHYNVAISTIRNAISIMKLAFKKHSHDGSIHIASEYLRDLSVQSAALLESSDTDSFISKMNAIRTNNVITVSTHTLNNDEFQDFYAVKQGLFPTTSSNLHYSSTNMIAMRLELDQNDDFEADLDVESAIMLNNFGVAHIMLSSISNSLNWKGEDLNQAALRVCALSQDILKNACDDVELFDCQSDTSICAQQLSLFLLGSVVMSNMGHILHKCANFADSQAAFSYLEESREVLMDLAWDDVYVAVLLQEGCRSAPVA